MKINVMVLGGPGAGKTMYLAGLYRTMGAEQVEISTTLRTDFYHGNDLEVYYRQAIRPDQWFPISSTWGVRTWPFQRVITGAHHREYTPFFLDYLDYNRAMLDPHHLTGEERKEDPGLQQFVEFLEKAHVYIILIDGHKLYKLLQGDSAPEVQAWLDEYLPPRLGAVRAQKPVHLVITKWDILSDHYSLEQVKDKLPEQDVLKNFVAARDLRRSLVRLIPVSVTGQFARLNSEGVMVKVPGQPV